MKPPRPFPLLFLLALLPPACRSAGPVKLASPDRSCTCGTAEGDMLGCLHEACLEEIGNPANPLCACGALSAPEAVASPRALSSGGTSTGAAAPRQYLVLADGTRLHGALLADDRMGVTVRLDDERERTVSYDDLAPRSIYRLEKARTPKDDGRRLLELANYARDHGLYAYAARHYGQAVAADPGLSGTVEKELQRWRRRMAEDRLQRAHRALASGDLAEAQHEAQALLAELPDERAAAEAALMLQEMGASEPGPATTAEDSEADSEGLARARARYERAATEIRRGLASRNSARAVKRIEEALELLAQTRAEVALIQDQSEADVPRVAHASALDREAVQAIVEAGLRLAEIHLAHGDAREALAAVETARRHSPEEPALLEMRRRIELEDNGLGWGVFGVAIHPGFLLLAD